MKSGIIPKIGAIVLLVAVLASVAIAGDAETPTPEKPPEPSKAISFPISYTGEGFGNLSGGYRRGAIYEGLLTVGMQGDLEKLMRWKGASFLVSGLYPHGASLTKEYVHDFNGVSSIDAYDSVRLYEAWFQQEFAEGKVSIRLGQILADSEFFVSDNGALFINGAFGAIPLISQNFDAPVFPIAAPGVRVRVTPSDSLSVQVGVFEGNVGDQSVTNKHGTTWRLNGDDGVLAIAEVAYKLNSEKGNTGLRGIYKVGAFYHSSGFDDFENASVKHTGDFGGYFIVDQQLWRKPGSEDQGLSGFLRIGATPLDRNTVPFYFECGLNFKGLFRSRVQDIAGIGLSYTSLNSTQNGDLNQSFSSHHETILEVTYKAVIKDWLSVQPDFQYIFTPGGDRAARNAVVAGIRFTLSYQ